MAAVSSGAPNQAIPCFSLLPELLPDGNLKLDVEDFPAVFLDMRNIKSATDGPDEEVTAISFVKEDDSDALLVASRHSSGGRLELWELRSQWQPTHKLFTPSGDGAVSGAQVQVC